MDDFCRSGKTVWLDKDGKPMAAPAGHVETEPDKPVGNGSKKAQASRQRPKQMAADSEAEGKKE